MLERLRLALDAPEQLALGGDTDAPVSFGLKKSGSCFEGAEVSGQEAEVVAPGTVSNTISK